MTTDERAGGTFGRGPSDPGFYEALGRAIKVLRAERGLERKELAEASGVSYPYLSEIENGKKQPSSKAVLALAEALGVAPSDLLAMAEQRAGSSGPPPPPASPSLPSPSFPSDRTTHASQAAPMTAAPRSYWVRSPSPAAASEPARGPHRARSETSLEGSTEQARTELEELVRAMPAEDVERLLDLARRLSGES